MDKFKIAIIAVLVVLIIAIVGIGVLLVSILGGDSGETNGEPVDYVPTNIEVFKIEDAIIGNLSGDNARYMLRMTVGFGVDADNKSDYKIFVADFEAKTIIIRDAIIGIIRNQTYEMMQAPDAKEKMAVEIRDVVNEIMGISAIYKIYFDDFIVN